MGARVKADDFWPAYELSHNLVRVVGELEPREKVFLHYCSLDAFYAIMDTGRLRFTSAKSTNDPSEFVFGREIVSRALTEIAAESAADTRRHLLEVDAALAAQDFRAFVFCMSEAVEDEAHVGELSQWRLYGADGRGVALVIDVSSADKLDMLTRLCSLPRRVVYGDADGLELVKSEIRTFFRGLPSLPKSTLDYLDQSPMATQGYLLNSVFWLPSVIKHKAYRHEREVRLIRGDIGQHAGNPLVFYERGSIRRPAIELPVSELVERGHQQIHSSPISAVIIGPSGDQSAIHDSIRYFLEARNWNLTVHRSDIPYRAV